MGLFLKYFSLYLFGMRNKKKNYKYVLKRLIRCSKILGHKGGKKHVSTSAAAAASKFFFFFILYSLWHIHATNKFLICRIGNQTEDEDWID